MTITGKINTLSLLKTYNMEVEILERTYFYVKDAKFRNVVQKMWTKKTVLL